MKFSEIVQKLGDNASCSSLILNTNNDPEITGLAAVDQAFPGTLSYIEGGKFVAQVRNTGASGLIVPQDEALQAQAQERGIAWIATSAPRLLFARVIALFYQPFHPAPEIHPTAVIHPSATLGNNLYIGAHVVIQAGVRIGDGVCIHPNVVIYPDAK
jgi:UDP-3-O-[3-hydroxymyristoyl] glucosamine N-acyltransferase